QFSRAVVHFKGIGHIAGEFAHQQRISEERRDFGCFLERCDWKTAPATCNGSDGHRRGTDHIDGDYRISGAVAQSVLRKAINNNAWLHRTAPWGSASSTLRGRR